MRSALLVAVAACVGTPPTRYADVPRDKQLAELTFALPAGWAAVYEPTFDRWFLAGPDQRARIERAPAASVASPEAYVHHRARGRAIARRETLRDGFAIDVADVTYVVRELRVWTQCYGSGGDIRALCTSVREFGRARPVPGVSR